MDPNVPVEETVKTLAEFVKEGKVDYIGLSECSADTLKRAYAVRLSLCASISVAHVYASKIAGIPYCFGGD